MTEQEAIKNFQGENKTLSQYAETKFQKEVFAKKIERNNMAIKALEKQRNNGWIPVDERLPDTKDYILLSFSNFTISLANDFTFSIEFNEIKTLFTFSTSLYAFVQYKY